MSRRVDAAFLEGCFDRQTIQVRMDYFCKVRVLVDRDKRWTLFNSLLTFVVPKMREFH